MSGSPSFALEVLACALGGIVFWAACAGVGFGVIGRRVESPGDEIEPAGWRQPGVAACVGLAVLIVLGGIAVVVRIPWWLVTAPFVVIGLALAFRELTGRHLARPRGPAALIGVVAVGAFVAVAAVEAVVGFRFPLHPWDDMRAYLPMAHRLIDTYGLDDAWNARRLQTVGGFTFLQAIPVAIFGHTGAGIIETMVAGIFLAGLFVANGVRTTWARLLSVAFIVAIPFFWVPRINTTGVLLGTPLLVAVLAITVELRRALRENRSRDAFRWAVAGGLVVAALMSVRPNLGLLAAVLIAGGTLWIAATRARARIQVLAIAAASTIVALLPWSLASLSSVDTPFYLVDSGNQNPQPIQLRAASGVVDLAEHTSHLLRAGPYLWVTVLALVVAVVMRKRLPDASFTVIAAALTVLVMVAVAVRGYTMAEIAFVRYMSPMSQALAVFLFCELLRSTDARTRLRVAPDRSRTAGVVGLVAVAGLVGLSYSGLGLSLEYETAPGGGSLVARALDNDLLPRRGLEVTTPRLRAAYRRALTHVDPDQTISAVDRPYLIDYSRYDIPNMDLPGFTAPGGEFPFLNGPGPKIARLRRAGYDTLLATKPNVDAAIRPAFLRAILELHLPSYSPTTRYYLDWEEDLERIIQRAPGAVQKYGPLYVINLRRAERDLGRH